MTINRYKITLLDADTLRLMDVERWSEVISANDLGGAWGKFTRRFRGLMPDPAHFDIGEVLS